MNQVYLDTARLLTHVAPLVLVDDTFALKGGTAINLFTEGLVSSFIHNPQLPPTEAVVAGSISARAETF
jgi:hypothetical protein